MMFSTPTLAILTLSVSAAGVSGEYIPAKKVESSNGLIQRTTFVGGWALGGGFDGACPAETSQCANLGGTCCPSSSTCTSEGNFGGVACCPSSSNCGQTILAIPACADPTWTLYQAKSSYFCCQPGQIGVNEVSGHIVNIVGLCVPSDQAVPSANLASAVSTATKVSSTTGSSSGPKTSAPTTATTPSSSTTSAAATSATQNAGVSNVVSVGGGFGFFGFLAIQFLL